MHLKHSSKGSSQYTQYWEQEVFLLQHLHYITHICPCGQEKKDIYIYRKDIKNKRRTMTQTKGKLNKYFKLAFRCLFGQNKLKVKQLESFRTESLNALSFHLPQHSYFSLLDKWDASFMRGGWDACLDWFWHWDICFVLCVVCLLDWWEDWGWRVMNWWQEGRWSQTTGPIIKGSEMPQVHGDWYYQRKSRLQRARDQLRPCQ